MKRLYYGTFTPGLERPVERMLSKEMGVSVERMLSGGALFWSNREPEIPYFLHVFTALAKQKACREPEQAIEQLLTHGDWLDRVPYEEIQGKTFRITVTDGRQKMPVNMKKLAMLEDAISNYTGMRNARQKSDTEFWLVIGKEKNDTLFLLRTLKREKPSGWMKPDLLHVIGYSMGFRSNEVCVANGNAGCGLPALLADRAKIVNWIVSPADQELQPKGGLAFVRCIDGTPSHTSLADRSQDSAFLYVEPCLTEAQWGDARSSLYEMKRILKEGGRLVLLGEEKSLRYLAAKNEELQNGEKCRFNINGKDLQLISVEMNAADTE